MPVTIEFDDLIYALQRFGGISEYWTQVTRRIDGFENFVAYHRQGGRWHRMQSPRSTSQVFHSSYFRVARGRGVKNVTTVHDMAYELGYVGSGIRSKLHRLERRHAYFGSDALICISNSTRRDLLDVYPALESRCPITVIPHGVSLSVEDIRQPQLPPPVSLPYVLFVGGRSAYKNFGNALEGFALSGLVTNGLRLFCTGSPLSSEEKALTAKLGLTGAVWSVGNIARGQLASLYASAYALLYPSLFEGFGLPILEAMQLGCPVVASNRSCIPEIAGDAALLVDATDPQSISSALLRLGNAELRGELICRGRNRAEGYSWNKSATQHADVYRMVAGIASSQRR